MIAIDFNVRPQHSLWQNNCYVCMRAYMHLILNMHTLIHIYVPVCVCVWLHNNSIHYWTQLKFNFMSGKAGSVFQHTD